MAYGYAANNPLNLEDPLGLDFLGISSKRWATIGLVAGGIALAATGVGLLADAGIIAGASAETIETIAGVTALATGGLATMTDVVPCVSSFSSADGPDSGPVPEPSWAPYPASPVGCSILTRLCSAMWVGTWTPMRTVRISCRAASDRR
jgi:hypothetical protein